MRMRGSSVHTRAFFLAVMLTASFVTAAAQDKSDKNAAVYGRAPRMVVPFTSFDFGDVYKGEALSQIFVIKNEGNADLNVELSATCSCEITWVDRIIAPGKEGRAQIEVDTSSQAGVTKKFAILHTNDP